MRLGGLFSIMYCTNCGKELPSTDARFCMECGSSVETEPICSNCGTILPYFVKYCPKCGEKTQGLVFDTLDLKGSRFHKLTLKNISISKLDVSHGELDVLNLDNIQGLKILDCSHNKLTSLNLSYNNSLVIIQCNDNRLTSLNISDNKSLRELYCYHNKLSVLNLENCTSLYKIFCSKNNITFLDISSLNDLRELINFDLQQVHPEYTVDDQTFCECGYTAIEGPYGPISTDILESTICPIQKLVLPPVIKLSCDSLCRLLCTLKDANSKQVLEQRLQKSEQDFAEMMNAYYNDIVLRKTK